MNRNVLLLTLCQATMMTSVSLVLSSSALIGAQLSPGPELATLPLAIQYLATLLMLFPLAWCMQRLGARTTFVCSALAGALGLFLAAAGIYLESFFLFAVSGLLIGIFNGAGQYYRFAAADAVATEHKSLAISLTLSGGLLAALLGPNLARWSRDALGPDFFASFLILAIIATSSALLAGALRLPDQNSSEPSDKSSSGDPLTRASLLKNPGILIAILAAVGSYAVMNLLMSATPLAMMHCGFGFDDTVWVIQWHLVAMFAPSFFTGQLIQRFGCILVMLLGCMLSFGSIGIGILGVELIHFEAALVLLGLGWNLLYIGASSLLVEHCHPTNSHRVRALNDTLVFAGVTVATLISGTLASTMSWAAINLYAGLPVLLIMIGLLVFRLQTRACPSAIRAS